MRLNFQRRYKWAFRPEYNDIKTPVIAPPQFSDFMPACKELLNVNVYKLSYLYQSDIRHLLAGRVLFPIRLSQVGKGYPP